MVPRYRMARAQSPIKVHESTKEQGHVAESFVDAAAVHRLGRDRDPDRVAGLAGEQTCVDDLAESELDVATAARERIGDRVRDRRGCGVDSACVALERVAQAVIV